LEISDGHDGQIDLLLSDVVMPAMSGVDLAKALKTKRPECRIILTSAHAPEMFAMDDIWRFIPKPSSRSDCLKRYGRHFLFHPKVKTKEQA